LKSETPEVPIFKAKNIPHEYELRVPVWVQDLTFLPGATDLVAIASRHGFLRLYDTREDNRNRPVINMTFCDHPIMSISPTCNNRQVIVGSSQGKVGLVDIRHYGKERLAHMFHGFNGSVRSIVADEFSPFFVSCGLDRHLYLHDLKDKAPIKKVYKLQNDTKA
jgi:ribosome biogenesis protein NSA1